MTGDENGVLVMPDTEAVHYTRRKIRYQPIRRTLILGTGISDTGIHSTRISARAEQLNTT
jgi:hypothetical protein